MESIWRLFTFLPKCGKTLVPNVFHCFVVKSATLADLLIFSLVIQKRFEKPNWLKRFYIMTILNHLFEVKVSKTFFFKPPILNNG